MLTKNLFKSRNISFLFAAQFFGGIIFFLPVVALYFEQELFTLQNVALIYATRSLLTVLLEVPTGAIADLFGRVGTIRIAFAIFLLGLVFLYVGGSMMMFLSYSFFWALASALESGTDNAFIYDSLAEEGRAADFKRVNGMYRVMWMLGAAIGSVFGGYMAMVSLRFPILLTFIPVVISLIFTFGLREPSYEKEDHRNVLKQMKDSSRVLFGSRDLVLISVIGFSLVGFSETTHMMKAIFYDFKGVPLVYFGYLAAATFTLASFGFYFSHWVSERVNEKWFLFVSVAIGGGLILAATFVNDWWWAALLMVLPALFFGLRGPVIDDIVNREVGSSKRATVNSLVNFARQIGMVLVAPFIGYFADLYDIGVAYQLTGIGIIVASVLFLGLKGRKKV